ncbi:MAG TPA: DinB family protein [Dehalococcoidia bacterium]|nr:DinB family protein [Dehalococcoidia bacterium]
MITEERTPTKAELLAALRGSGDEAVARLRAMDAAAFEQGRYENGWNGREILAHIASIEWTYARLLDVAKDAPPGAAPAGGVRRTNEAEGAGMATRSARGGIDDYNARQVEKRAGASAAELIDELAANRARTIAAVEGVDSALLAAPIRSAGGITGPLAGVLMAVAVQHVRMHVADITGEPWAEQRW